MREGLVYENGRLAGRISEISPKEYVFRYDDDYFADKNAPAKQIYKSQYLFPFFFNMLSEGHNRTVQAKIHKLDMDDDFGFLLATCHTDTPGSVTVKKI